MRKDCKTSPIRDIPYLLETQIHSAVFGSTQSLKIGPIELHPAFKSVFPIESYSGNAVLEYVVTD